MVITHVVREQRVHQLQIKMSVAGSWKLIGSAVQPRESGSFSVLLPPNVTSVSFIHISETTSSEEFVSAASSVQSPAIISWSATLPPGPYVLVAWPGGLVADRVAFLHSRFSLDTVAGKQHFSVAGGQEVLLRGTGLYATDEAIVRFTGARGGRAEVAARVRGNVVSAISPAWVTPAGWFDRCDDVSQPQVSSICVPDLAASANFQPAGLVLTALRSPLRLALAA